MLPELKRMACEANRLLPVHGLAPLNFGNASAFDKGRAILAIKPSGVDYATLAPADMVLVDLEGRVVEGRLRPSSDTATHVELYRRFPGVGGIVHTHSPCATAFAQAGRPLPCLGTTHSDFFNGPVPVTRAMKPAEIAGAYESETGRLIAEAVGRREPLEVSAVLVRWHAPFIWAATASEAVEVAIALEFCARIALDALRLNPSLPPVPRLLLNRHFQRKHGPGAYYGQK